jgi:hypothetical protein
MKTQIESLERRTLMSGAWTTVINDATQLEVDAMAADKTGNIYAVAWPSDTAMAVLKSSDGGASWNVIAQGSPSTSFNSIATDATGNVFVAATDTGTDGSRHWRVLEQAVGQSDFSIVDDVPKGNCVALATDSAGDVYAVGSITVTTAGKGGKTTSTNYQTVRRRLAGQPAFSTVDQVTGISFNAVTAIDGGASAGVYVTGMANGAWTVRKSINAGQNWSVVDQYTYPTPSGTTIYNEPAAVVGDLSGNIFVAGTARQYTVIGYNKNHTPIYRPDNHWLVRKSSNGGASWTNNDDFQLVVPGATLPHGMGTDLAGNVYVVGEAWTNSSTTNYALVRTNAGGAWATVDNYTGSDGQAAEYAAFTADSNGNLYAGGFENSGWVIRSAAGPISPVASASVFSSFSISGSSIDQDKDEILA